MNNVSSDYYCNLLQSDHIKRKNMEKYSLDDREQFVEDILLMLDKGSSNDIKIQLSDGELHANLDILTARSEYFKMMFDSMYKEGRTKVVNLSQWSKVTMEKIIKYLFSGAVNFEDLTLPQLLEVSHISDVILLTKFKDQLEDYLRFEKIPSSGEDLTFLSQLLTGLKLADQYNLFAIEECIIEELFYSLWGILLSSRNDSFNHDAFKNLSLKLMKKIVLYPKPEANDRKASTTKERFDAFILWLSSNNISDNDKEEIVDGFDFEDFTVEDLLSTVKHSGFYSQKKIDRRVTYMFKTLDAQNKKKSIQMQTVKEKLREVSWYFPEDKISEIERLME